MASVEFVVGRGLRDAVADVAVAWEQAASLAEVEPTSRICIADWNVLAELLTPKRRDLLRHLRGSPEDGVRALARALERDVKHVGEDVAALVGSGLVARDEAGRLRCDLDAVTATVRLAPPGRDREAVGPRRPRAPRPARAT